MDSGFDAGTDAGIDAGADAGMSDGCPAYDGGDAWCLGRLDRCQRCASQMQKCEKDNIAFCVTDGSNYSPEVLTVLGQCEASHACQSDGLDFSACVRAAMDALPLNAARQALASAYCSKCVPGTPTCVDTFFDRNSGDRGALLSDSKDSVINTVKQHCVDPQSADCGSFVVCAYSYVSPPLKRVDLCHPDGGS